MKIKAVGLLLFFYAGFCISSVFAYTAILKNGKTIKGQLVSETESFIILKDDVGIRLNIKKTQLDSEKTRAANAASQEAMAEDVQIKPPSKKVDTRATKDSKKKVRTFTNEDLGQTARESSKPEKGRIYTPEDIQDMPELSQFEGNDTHTAANYESSDFDDETEKKWKAEALDFWRKIESAESRFVSLAMQCLLKPKSFIGKTSISGYYITMIPSSILTDIDSVDTTVPVNPSVIPVNEQARLLRSMRCNNAKLAHKVYVANVELVQNTFLRKARQESIPPGWLDPSRF